MDVGKVNKDGAKRTAKGAYSLHQAVLIQIFYQNSSNTLESVDPMKDKLDCQVNYIIVIGDGIWMNHKQGLKDIKTLKGKDLKPII